MGKNLVLKNKLIQAVLRCKVCGQFLNLYEDQRMTLFSNIEFKEIEDLYNDEPWLYNTFHSPGSPTTHSPIVKCKCDGAISGDPDLFRSYEEDSERYESFFIRSNDKFRFKTDRLVGKFINTSRKKIYHGLVFEADDFHIKRNCTFEGPFSKDLKEIADVMVNNRTVSKYSIGESINSDVLEQLKSRFAS